MKEIVLNVGPAAEGWWINCDLPLEPTYFLSADLAEQTARSLALRLTDLGRDVRLFVRDGLNRTVATYRYFSL
jgi:hypothetical protein